MVHSQKMEKSQLGKMCKESLQYICEQTVNFWLNAQL
jgi:hypothetical protein